MTVPAPAGPASGPPLAFRVLLSTLLLPGVVAGLIPWWIFSNPMRLSLELGPWHWLGVAPLAAGLTVLVATIVDFAVVGRGTLAPWDAPQHLVTTRRYRWVRNPMYLGVLAIILGEGMLWQSGGVLIYGEVVAVAFHLRVIAWEEPTLRQEFGEAYADYCRRVPRWWPRRPVPPR